MEGKTSKNDFDDDCVKFPTSLLRLFGFLPFTGQHCCIRIIVRAIGLLHLLAAAIGCIFVAARGITYLVVDIAIPGLEFSIVVKIFGVGPFFSQYGRPVIVLIIFLYKTESFRSLCQMAKDLAAKLFITENGRKAKYRQWQWTATGLGIATLLVHVAWECCNLLPAHLTADEEVKSHYNVTAANIVNSTGINFVLSMAMVILRYFELAMFYISQQVLVLALVFGIILRAFLKKNNDNIRKLHDEIFETFFLKLEPFNKYSEKLFLELDKIEKIHWDVYFFFVQLNDLFGYIAFFAFILDQVTVLGNVAQAISMPSLIVGLIIYIGVSVVVFACYSLAFVWPFVKAEEEVGRQSLCEPGFDPRLPVVSISSRTFP